jgi:hypothetical protein
MVKLQYDTLPSWLRHYNTLAKGKMEDGRKKEEEGKGERKRREGERRGEREGEIGRERDRESVCVFEKGRKRERTSTYIVNNTAYNGP